MQGSRLILNLRAKHATNISGPSSLADLTFTIPSHMYSAIDFEDPDSEPKDKDGSEDAEEDVDADTDREDAALNPSRSNTASSHSHSRLPHARNLSDVESASSSSSSGSPLAAMTRLPP